MLINHINFSNFKIKPKKKNLKKKLNLILKENNHIIQSLKKNYKNSFKKETIKKHNNHNFRIIGMGGSSLGAQAIYDFLKSKIKKNFLFNDNLNPNKDFDKKRNYTNIVISKSGNTIETIANSNILIRNKDKNIFITEKKK